MLIGLAGCADPSFSGQPGFIVSGPDIGSGLRLEYTTSGLADLADELVVVVRPVDGNVAYLFEGGRREDLIQAATNPSSADWYGPHDTDLNLAFGTTVISRLFEWPLRDGASWAYDDFLTGVEARAADVATPSGPERGFRMTAEADGVRLEWEYAPSVGYVTSLRSTADGTTYHDLRLRAAKPSTDAGSVWFERRGEPEIAGGERAGIVPFEVDNADSVVAYARGSAGCRVELAPPVGSLAPAWTASVEAREGFDGAILDGEPGAWTASATPAPGGFCTLQTAPVAWIETAPGGIPP